MGHPQIWEVHTWSLVLPKPSSPSLFPMFSFWTSPQLLQTPVPFQSNSTLLSYCQLSSGKNHLIYLFPLIGVDFVSEMEQDLEQL